MREERWCRIISKPYLYYLFFLSGFAPPADAQVVGKFSPAVKALSEKKSSSIADFVIALSDSSVFSKHIVNLPGIEIVYAYPSASVYVVKATPEILEAVVRSRNEILFVDVARKPFEEVAVSNIDMSLNRVSLLQRRFPGMNGEGIHASIKENRPDIADIDFKGRYVAVPLASATLSSHATIMATLVAGAGNSFYEGKGVAPRASFSSVNFSNLLPEPDDYYQQYDVTVQNHSYGTGIENYYGPDARSYDVSVQTRSSLLHVFSVGNSGNSAGTSAYAGINGFANTTGSFKMAKNILTVGHTDSSGTVMPASSRGPGYDGRLMPSLVAFGEDGSSGAAAIVSGIVATLQQAYRTLHGTLPASSLVRAILLNSADDTGPKGLDFLSGYGAANAHRAMEDLTGGRFFSGAVSNGGQNTHSLTVSPGVKQLKVTLTWNDLPATANALVSLVNDLDMELVEIPGGTTWLPWVLSHYPHPDSLTRPAVRKKDRVNNVEQITIENPAPGTYQVVVNGFSVIGSQSYHISYHIDTLNGFQWDYPTSTDHLLAGRSNRIRWNCTYPPGTVDSIQVSFDNLVSFETIARAPIENENFRWQVPDFFGTAHLRMHIGNETFLSEPFMIAKRPDLFVGFNCNDSFALYWRKQPGADSYRLYRLGPLNLESFLTTTDTLVVLQKSSNPSFHYAVVPMDGPLPGVRSYTYHYENQGTGCYIRSFYATLNATGNAADLFLELGTDYGLHSIVWEKWETGGFTAIGTSAGSGTVVHFSDNQLKSGSNLYRAKVRLLNGSEILTSTETVYFMNGSMYILYPNPVQRAGNIRVLNAALGRSTLFIYNSAGILIRRLELDEPVAELPVNNLNTGLYFFRFITETGRTETLKLIVQ